MTLFDRLKEGVDQIEVSSAKVGIVMVSFKDRLPHETLFPKMGADSDGTPILGSHRNLNDIERRLREFGDDRFNAMIEMVTKDKIWKTIDHKKALPGALISLMVGVGISTQLGPAPSVVGFLQLVPLEFNRIIYPSVFDCQVMTVLENINRGHRVI